MGNHEYGIGGNGQRQTTANMSMEIINKMAELKINLIKEDLVCPIIKEQKICFYGIDDIWKNKPEFNNLPEKDNSYPLIFLTHNPDGILYYPKNKKQPDLTLSGHTHGGQVWLPFIGPVGNAGIKLDKKYYRGQQIYNNLPIYISVGVGESGGAIRFLSRPEISIIEIR